ncbi:MAG TPA: YXWGXW repeat-containing protein, partial [Ramlibacter sp.]|nr:YXWGXW repeat-containing protein [Ramlibacter sp.]
MIRNILLATAVAASCGTAPLIATAAQRAIVITQPPPPLRDEEVPPPRHGQEWAPGHWVWRHGEHVWVAGHWMHERHGQHWVADRWVERDGHWMMQPGHWERGMRDRDQAMHDGEDAHRMGNRGDSPRMHDNDRDGVPNRYDS